MKLAIIPARGGSKRIPRKNIKLFCGQPMIAWSIQAALKSGCFDQVIVSTDDSEIAEVALRFGAQVPFMRPQSLADDHTGTLPVIHHAIDSCAEMGFHATQVCCIYATAPFLTANDIVRGLALSEHPEVAYAFTATTYAFPIQRALKLHSSGGVEMFNPECFETRSQDLEEAFHDAGQFYWGKAASWQRELPFFTPQSRPVLLPRHRVQDIDTLEDWVRAEWMFKAMQVAHR
ncbi:pseudaminic acid cytidylyltransferase [Pseudomonas alkylphenolica]|uniref:pseudaminic acid cytidylyltransferase n=1 Tax=Pseudomonas alkylphenolica TaxID=237609 RepID=UPI003391E4D4